jgi:amino acid transporter
VAIVLLTWLNLRGVRESATAVAFPVFLFIFSVGAMIAVGLWKVVTQAYTPSPAPEVTASHPLNWFLVLRAFAGGCVALTGIEAVSNGVQAFREPAPTRARITLAILGLILGSFFIGITLLARIHHITPRLGEETVLSQVGRRVFGNGLPYYVLQLSTLIILLLAANTSFAGFPRVTSLLARDGFLPRQLANLGDRLVFSNGIALLGGFSILLVLVFRGSTHALIPLYAVGVFLSFTLAQLGLLRRWVNDRPPGWFLSSLCNALGGFATGVVLVVVGAAKFIHGAWIVVVAIPALVRIFYRIRHHYDMVASQLSLEGFQPRKQQMESLVVVPVASLHRGTVLAMEYARSLSRHVRAVHVISDEAAWQKLRERWVEWEPDTPIVGLPSPYRSVIQPIVEYVKKHLAEYPMVTVLIPEFVVAHWWEHLLHNQSAIALSLALRHLRGVAIVHYPYQLEE